MPCFLGIYIAIYIYIEFTKVALITECLRLLKDPYRSPSPLSRSFRIRFTFVRRSLPAARENKALRRRGAPTSRSCSSFGKCDLPAPRDNTALGRPAFQFFRGCFTFRRRDLPAPRENTALGRLSLQFAETVSLSEGGASPRPDKTRHFDDRPFDFFDVVSLSQDRGRQSSVLLAESQGGVRTGETS